MENKVMVVSADSGLTGFLNRNLPRRGYQVINTRADEQLRRAFEEVNPDLVVMDLLKTENHELDLCQRIRQWSAAPVLMVSTWQTGEGKVREPDGAHPANSERCVDIQELLGQIEKMISGKSFSPN